MHCAVAKISFTCNRTCFVGLPRSLISKFSNDKVNGIKIDSLTGSLCTSWSGDVTGDQQVELEDTVEINGLFASKLGFYNKQEVTVTILPPLHSCVSAQVEPASVDDWEILEMNASAIESNLLNQVRVVSIGQIFPIWVQKSTCIYVTIGHLEPSSNICVLHSSTELIISPKSRHSFVQGNASLSFPHDRTHSGVGDSLELNGLILNESNVPLKRNNNDDDSAGLFDDSNNQISKRGFGIFSYLTSFWKGSNEHPTGLKLQPTIDKVLPKSFSASFRVLALEDFVESRNCSDHFTSFFQKSGDFLDASLQAYNVFVSQDSILTVGNLSFDDLPSCFLARLSKLPSPAQKEDSLKQKVNLKASDKSILKLQENTQSPEKSEEGTDHKSVSNFIIVRVMIVLLDSCCRISELINLRCKNAIPHLHALIHTDLRRMLNLEKTSRIQIDSLETLQDSIPCEILMDRLFPLPEGFTDDMLHITVQQQIESITRPFCPLVLNDRAYFRCFIKEGLIGEFFVTLGWSSSVKDSSDRCYFLLSPKHIEKMKLTIVSMKRSGFQSPPPLVEFDSDLTSVTFNQLHIDTATKDAVMEYIDVCLRRDSFVPQLFHCSLPGLANGGLLLCGAKGSGKTSIGLAICSAASTAPYYAFVETVECKMLKGKKPETIQQYFGQKFDELSWRRPSVLFLDDLDHLATSSSGPEQDMSGLASYHTRVAEVLRDLMQREACNGSPIAVVASAVSSNSIHSLLVKAKGDHIFTRMIEIKPPNQINRTEVLRCILRNRKDVAGDLNLLKMSAQTEGYTAKDLDQIVNRAIHATLLSSPRNSSCQIVLQDKDIEAALVDFVPTALRSVALVQSDELSWADVGGLSNVRSVLIQTLQWPSKYLKLFSCCPLRLQSGILLYGAPGTGKTHLAAVIAKEFNLNFISVKGPELFNKYIGASEQAVRDTFARAQSAKPCILFFDEFESLAPKRGHDNTGVTDRVVNQLLTQLDGVENLDGVFVLAATSRPDLIDSALLRPGRLDRALHCPIPSKTERLEILKALSRKMQLSEDVDLQAVADECVDFTGADFKAMLYNAQLEAMHEQKMTWKPSNVSQELGFFPLKDDISPSSNRNASTSCVVIVSHSNLLHACHDIQPSVSPSERHRYSQIYKSFVGSRGENFAADNAETVVGQRVTLA